MRTNPTQPEIVRLSREVLRFDRYYSRRRTLRRMEPMGFITVSRAGDDGRRRQVALTARGLVIARDLEEFYEDRVRRVLRELPPRQQRRLVRAMQSIIDILEQDPLTNFLATLRK